MQTADTDPTIVTMCAGNGVVTVHEPGRGYSYAGCPGCPDCAPRPPKPITAESKARAFDRLPVVEDEPW